jgi:polyvinyl alcohol dehydrogenase (cytochrome)
MYGHDPSNSRNAGPGGPSTAQARGLGSAWSFQSKTGGMTGTPVVANGTVVVGSNDGGVYALDAATGAQRWQQDLKLPDQYISGSAAIAGSLVYVPVAARSGPVLAALSLATGKVMWSKVLDTQPGADTYSSPIVNGNTVYIGTSGTPVENGRVNSHVRGAVVALDAANGNVVWRTYLVPRGYDGAGIWSTPTIDSRTQRLYVGTGNAYHAPAHALTDSIVQLDLRTGRILRHFSAKPRGDVYTDVNRRGPDFDFGATPNLLRGPGGRTLVGELQKSRVYWAVDAKSLRPIWKRGTSRAVGARSAEALASTAWDGRRIYGLSDDGEAWAITSGGRPVWRTKPESPPNYSPVAVANGVVYTIKSQRGTLEARDARTGKPLAHIRLGSPAWGGVSVAGSSVFAVTGNDTTHSGYLVAYRPRG